MDEWSENKLMAIALALGARDVPAWSEEETRLVHPLPILKSTTVEILRKKIEQGQDPLGEGFCQIRSAAERRERGATYTPVKIVKAMLDWAERNTDPARIVDPGTGSGRFLIEAGRRFTNSKLIGIELDPLAAIIARGNLASAGMAHRTEIYLSDFRKNVLPVCDGNTLFVGNPPYVRHHLIEAEWKEWLVAKAQSLKLPSSQLAGLHVYFYLATVLQAKKGDWGAFITSAEWLDVNYGKLLRDLFINDLGGRSLITVDPTAKPFPDAATTAAISTFEIGSRPSSVFFKHIADLNGLKDLESGRRVRRERLENEQRWSHFSRGPHEKREGYIELGELCRVHRGQVTGYNEIWIEGPHSSLLPTSVLFPTVTRARELFQADRILMDGAHLKRVIDLPIDLNIFAGEEKRVIRNFLKAMEDRGAHTGYVAKNRKAWWSVGLREPAPILATYMARRPPAFVRNIARARHLNIAHGLYPREPMSEDILKTLVEFLSQSVKTSEGRTYAGGLTKFEPREMERILIPSPEMLNAHAA